MIFQPLKKIAGICGPPQPFFVKNGWPFLLDLPVFFSVATAKIRRVHLGGGFKLFFMFTPTWGKIPILTNIFQLGWFNHQLVMFVESISGCGCGDWKFTESRDATAGGHLVQQGGLVRSTGSNGGRSRKATCYTFKRLKEA